MSHVAETPPPYAVVIEDDAEVAELLSLILRQTGFRPVVAEDGPSGVEAVRRLAPTIATVDVALPGLDGLEVTRQIREFSSTYLVMVSSLAGEDDILGGFAAGADDYVAKPFRPRELRSRFLAVLRRPPYRFPIAMAAPPPPPEPEPVRPVPVGEVEFEDDWVTFRGLRLNPDRGVLTVDGRDVALPRLEFDLLELMLYAGTQSRSRGELALSLRGETYTDGSAVRESDHELVAAAMGALLAKIGEDTSAPLWIETDGAGGYRLVPPQPNRTTLPAGAPSSGGSTSMVAYSLP
ncbi:response regulator transcription factor [Nocardioides mangrovi]|uniref:Response regulator transcription factor n=1 Tax=Nocardioides mangrovi TaxID=2874580 RepID=A0ABS7UHB9_9ACTN|nr:response regulator transcription factor [Nocardioides mangrovi]MBZ5740220.1 response regulator transcription factor [Nocardioides mangrovi]